jgi:hypothetical protein
MAEQNKPETTLLNRFIKGVNTDIAEDLIPEGFLSNGHNIKFTNDDNRQGIVQKQESYIKELNGYGSHLKPLAAQSLNDVIYIVSFNMEDPQNPFMEYGSYPSANLSNVLTDQTCPKVMEYAPLPNYKDELIAYVSDNFMYEGPPRIYTVQITTNNGGDWIVDGGVPAGVTMSSTSGPSSEFTPITIEVTAPDSVITNTYIINVRHEFGTILTPITIVQGRNKNSVGYFSPDVLTANTGDVPETDVFFTPGLDSTTWHIGFSNEDNCATIFPLIGSEDTHIYATLSGTVGQSGIYSLVDDATGSTLDTISININPVLPTVSTADPVVNIQSRGADAYGTVLTTGGRPVTDRGIMLYDNVGGLITSISAGSGLGTIHSILTGLTHTTDYSVKAYATNSVGTALGAEVFFTTIAEVPTVHLTSVDTPTSLDAQCAGDITDGGGVSVTARGFAFSTSSSLTPPLATSVGTGTGVYNSAIGPLSYATKYYVRAYATNSVGTAYSPEELDITTLAIVPVLRTEAVTSITATTATGNGVIERDGGSRITARGFKIGISSPTSSILDTSPIYPLGIITSDSPYYFALTSLPLASSTSYYVQAYATNSIGTSLGNIVSFTTDTPPPPSVTIDTFLSVVQNSLTVSHSLSYSGSSTILEHGIVYSTSFDPTYSGNLGRIPVSITPGTYETPITGLSSNTLYYINAYVSIVPGVYVVNTNHALVISPYSPRVTTAAPVVPTLDTTVITSITDVGANASSSITNDGGIPYISERGFCWRSDNLQDPTTADTTNIEGGTTSGAFNTGVGSFVHATTYYIRSYAITTAGTGYGAVTSFTTLPIVPSLNAPTNDTPQALTTTLNATVFSDGGDTITAKGFYWGTTNPPTNQTTSVGTGTGAYSLTLTGLTPSTTYYYTSYATNSAGTGHSNPTWSVSNFDTTADVINITIGGSGGNTMSSNAVWSTSFDVIERGVVYMSGVGTPTYSGHSHYILSSNPGTTGLITNFSIPSLTTGTYSARAYTRETGDFFTYSTGVYQFTV